MDRRTATCNRRLAKKRFQCLNEALCFVSSFVVADSLVLRNPLLRQAPKRYRALRSTLHILFILPFLIGCKNSKKDIQKLELGVYYLNNKLSNDTLFFQTNKPKSLIRNWNKKVWKITEDSIFQDDSRGLTYYFGKDKCSYSLSDDTLTVKYKSNIGDRNKVNNETVINIDKYIVLRSDKDFLELIEIEDSNAMNSKIRSDIQLR